MGESEIHIRLLVAVLLGAAIGFERQWHQGLAGLRTNALVALGSALFVSVNMLVADSSATRVAAQVVSGIGFLCAGVIMRQGLSVLGLNTAATMWCASGVGVLAGMGELKPATSGAAIIIIANLTLRRVSQAMDARHFAATESQTHYVLRVSCAVTRLSDVRHHILNALSGTDLRVRALESEHTEPGRVEVRSDIYSQGRADEQLETLVERLSLASEIEGIRWEVSNGDEREHDGGPFGGM